MINVTMLIKIFTTADRQILRQIADDINHYAQLYKLDTALRLSHFFAQIKEEVGSSICLQENLNYSASALKSTFRYFRLHPDEAERFGRTSRHPADQQAIANRVYANRGGNGDIASGDGWLYRGRGLIQLTCKDNYQLFQQNYQVIFKEDSPDFIANPDLLLQPHFAIRSAVCYWLMHKLYSLADQGPTNKVVDSITKGINPETLSYGNRRMHFKHIWSNKIFESVD